jgi:hypothetical protein
MHPPNGIGSIACSASPPEPNARVLIIVARLVDFSFKFAVKLRRSVCSNVHGPRKRTGLSQQANPSLSAGIKSTGKGFARARDRAAFWRRNPSSPAAETGKASPDPAKVAEHRGLLKRPQEIRYAPDCVVVEAVLREPLSAANSLLAGKLTGNFADCRPFGRFGRLFSWQLQ